MQQYNNRMYFGNSWCQSLKLGYATVQQQDVLRKLMKSIVKIGLCNSTTTGCTSETKIGKCRRLFWVSCRQSSTPNRHRSIKVNAAKTFYILSGSFQSYQALSFKFYEMPLCRSMMIISQSREQEEEEQDREKLHEQHQTVKKRKKEVKSTEG